MESETLIQLNKNIAEVKKRILLVEGQKKANVEEWEKKKDTNNQTIATLKKEIKEYTDKLMALKHPTKRRPISEPGDNCNGKLVFPIGAANAEEAFDIMDLKLIESRKQYDLMHSQYLRRQQYFNNLIYYYRELLYYKDTVQNLTLSGPPPETLEEDANRKLVCHLENEIHRTNVQWMEAEHIRKKYRSIKASLMNDAERFEKSLKELEQALADQQNEINRLQQVHKNAIEMRDTAKIILQRQEQQLNSSNKARERQALEFKKQIEERKLELERIERTLFATGGSGKNNLAHQDSIGSSLGDQLTGKTDQQEDENNQLKRSAHEMEELFKTLMEVTGATTPQEVLERFLSQKESTTRLTYLRNAAEEEKKSLENKREMLTNILEASKFSDSKESEENQEVIESIKTDNENLKIEEEKNVESIKQTEKVIKSIKETLFEMIYKLQEADETDIIINKSNINVLAKDLPYFLENNAKHSDLIDILEIKIQKIFKLIALQKKIDEPEDYIGEYKAEDLHVSLNSTRAPSVIDDKPQPQPLPMCYYNLMLGRTGQSISASPGAGPQQAAPDDEAEVPSRSFLKKQAALIVDSKSRRKGFRPVPQRRK